MNSSFGDTPDIGLRASRLDKVGRPKPCRLLPILALLAATGCGTRRFESMTEPVQAFLDEVKSGARGPARLRYCFSERAEERDIESPVRMISEAIERYGTKVRFEVMGAVGPMADLRLTFPGPGAPSFHFGVGYEANGWRIRIVSTLS